MITPGLLKIFFVMNTVQGNTPFDQNFPRGFQHTLVAAEVKVRVIFQGSGPQPIGHPAGKNRDPGFCFLR